MDYQESTSLTITETNTLLNIPYHEYFKIEKQWVITPNKTDDNTNKCTIKIYVNVIFLKSTVLKGTIERQTKDEMSDMAEKWYKKVSDYLIAHPEEGVAK